MRTFASSFRAPLLVGLLAYATLGSGSASARTVSFDRLSAGELGAFLAGTSDVTVAFAKGDVIPVQIEAKGDLVATVGDASFAVQAQRDFYLRRDGDDVLLSIDGVKFAPLLDQIHGTLSAQASGGSSDASGHVDHLNVLLEAWLATPADR